MRPTITGARRPARAEEIGTAPHPLDTVSRRGAAIVAVLAMVVAGLLVGPTPAVAVPTAHEITARWAGTPGPTTAPYGEAVTSEWRINTNDADDPFSNEDVNNVRAVLTAGNGVFTSIPVICKTSGVTPVSEISPDGATLLCNIGTVQEGTSTIIQAPVRASGRDGGNLTLSGTATSDSATGIAGPADPGPLPITYTHGMDLTLVSAPGSGYQGYVAGSRTGGQRAFIQMNFSLVLASGSRPGPANYSFPVTIGSNVAGATTGLQWEACVPVGNNSPSTGQPFSDPAQTDRTNFPTCSVSGSGASYTVSLSNLDYSLVNTPINDSFRQPLPGGGAYIASGTVQFSIPAAVTAVTNYTFTASPGPFTFDDGVQSPDASLANNASNTTLTPTGGYSVSWGGAPAASRAPWDTNLWVSPGTSTGVALPAAGINTDADLAQAAADGNAPVLPLYMQSNSQTWNNYTGPGGAQIAGSCLMNQNPDFVITSMDGGGYTAAGYDDYSTARFYYTTQAIDTKTETCGQAAPSGMWIEVTRDPGTTLGDPRVGAHAPLDLPPGVTAVKMTWNPAVDQLAGAGVTFLRAFGHISSGAPTSGEGWAVGAFNGNFNPATAFPGYPTLNGWVNPTTSPGGANLPGSTYGPNINGYRDAFRLQGPQGLITKSAGDTTAQPGVPVTYTLQAQAQNTVTNPPPASFTVVDTLPAGMEYVAGSASPAPTSVSGQTLTWQFTDVAANVFQTITYRAQIPPDGVVAPGTRLTNTATVDVPGDNRLPTVPGRSASATVLVPSSSSTHLGKSTEDNLLSFFGDSSAWVLTINSQDPDPNPFTDTIDVLPQVGDGRGTDIDGGYTVSGVTAPAGSTVYYTAAPFGSVNSDPRHPSNGGSPGSIAGNTVGWSTTAIPNPTAIRVIGPELAPGATQTIRIAYDTPSATSCETPADGDNKPGQILVNSANSIAGHTGLPMLSSATAVIGSCYAADLKKYVQDSEGVWHDANDIAEYPTFRVGDTVRYRIVVENVGQGTITNLRVADDRQPTIGSFVVESLARGESETHEFEITLPVGTPDALVNTACATADPPVDGELVDIPCDPAGLTVDGDPTHTKTLISATPLGAGQWQLVYGIDVSNSQPYSTSYTLDDTLHFTSAASIVSATVSSSPAGVTLAAPPWDGQASVRIATSVPLAGNDDVGYAPHQYELTVVADVPLQLPGAGSGAATDPAVCPDDGSDADRAFNNESALTKVDADVEEDQACAPIPSIDIAKSVASGPTPNGDGTWTVVYDVVATNAGGADGVYDMRDRMIEDGDLVVVSGEVVTTPAGVTASPAWTGLGPDLTSPENLIADAVTLPADTTHTYQVEIVLTVDANDGVPEIADCSAMDGGLLNTAEIEHNDLTDQAEACITVASVIVEKTVSVGPTGNGDGSWTVTYDIVAENVGAADGQYDVYDQLLFGSGIDVLSAEVVTTPSGITAETGWTGLGATQEAPENLIAAGVDIVAGGVHAYQVEVRVQLDDAVTAADLACPPPGAGENGGLTNSTHLVSNGIVVEDEVCPSLPLIRFDKEMSVAPMPNGDGTWTIVYDLIAINSGQATGEYDLFDRLRYGAGIEIESAAVITIPAGVTAPSAWTGLGPTLQTPQNQVAAAISLSPDETHIYQVQVVVSLDQAVVTPDTLTCPGPGSSESGGLANSARLTHNGENADDDTCAELPLITIVKSIAGAVTPVVGQEGRYDVTYRITVTNSGPGDGAYHLDDRLQPGDGVTVIGIQGVTGDAPDPVAFNPGYDGVADVRIVTAQPIVGADGGIPVVHTYEVTVRFAADFSEIPLFPVADSCRDGGETVDGGLNNIATISWNGIEDADEECILPGKPTLDKELLSADDIGDGQWRVVYELTIGNVRDEPTRYDLDDELLLAPVITVDTVTVTGPEGVVLESAFDGTDSHRIASDVTIAGLDDDGYEPHVYTVTVIVDVPEQFPDIGSDGTGSPACTNPEGSNMTRQGLNNAATLTDENGTTSTDTDCAPVPSRPKTPLTTTGAEVGQPIGWAAGLLLLGVTALILTRRRTAGS